MQGEQLNVVFDSVKDFVLVWCVCALSCWGSSQGGHGSQTICASLTPLQLCWLGRALGQVVMFTVTSPALGELVWIKSTSVNQVCAGVNYLRPACPQVTHVRR